MNKKYFYITLLSFLSFSFVHGQTSPLENLYHWQSLPELPYQAYNTAIGVSNGALIIAGGADNELLIPQNETNAKILDTLAVLETETGSWLTHQKLPFPIACAAVANYQNALILIGGRDENQCFDSVLQITWNSENKTIYIKSLVSLPHPIAYASAACLDNTVYLFGGVETLDQPPHQSYFYSLDLSQIDMNASWHPVSTAPDMPTLINPIVITQSNGEKDALFIFGGKPLESQSLNEAWRFEPFQKDPALRWVQIQSSPTNLFNAAAFTSGQTHILFAKFDELFAYHTITNTWMPAGEQPPGGLSSSSVVWNDTIACLGEPQADSATTPLIAASLNKTNPRFGLLNYITLGGYLACMVFVGFYFSKREKSVNDYFLAGKRIPGWAAGISIFATTFSAISMIGTPAKVFATNWVYFFATVAILPVLPFVIYCFIPFVRKLDVTTAYEYLEKRFNTFVRLFGSLTFILFQLGRMAIVLLLPSIALATVTGINIQVCILTMGVLCIVYTVLGGIEAVIWTDVLQFAVLIGGIFLSFIIIITDIDGGLSTFFSTAKADHQFQFTLLSWDYTVPSLWVALIGNSLSNISPYLTDQSVVQRYLTTPNIKQANNSLWFNFYFILPNTIIIFALGTALYVFYKHNPGLLNPALQTDAIFPLFIVQKMPAGVCGLVIAGIFAASMSSLDSAMHSVATAIINDFYIKARPHSSEQRRLNLARWTTGLLGVSGTGAAMILAMHNLPSLWDFFMTLLGLLGGGITGVFLLGIFTRRTHGPGAFIGALVSAILVFLVQKYTATHFFLYGAIGVVSAMIVGYLASLIIPIKQKDITGLTIYTINK